MHTPTHRGGQRSFQMERLSRSKLKIGAALSLPLLLWTKPIIYEGSTWAQCTIVNRLATSRNSFSITDSRCTCHDVPVWFIWYLATSVPKSSFNCSFYFVFLISVTIYFLYYLHLSIISLPPLYTTISPPPFDYQLSTTPLPPSFHYLFTTTFPPAPLHLSTTSPPALHRQLQVSLTLRPTLGELLGRFMSTCRDPYRGPYSCVYGPYSCIGAHTAVYMSHRAA